MEKDNYKTDIVFRVDTSKLATAEEYADLKKEMESIGYKINVVKKRNYDKYLQSYKSVRGIKN